MFVLYHIVISIDFSANIFVAGFCFDFCCSATSTLFLLTSVDRRRISSAKFRIVKYKEIEGNMKGFSAGQVK